MFESTVIHLSPSTREALLRMRWATRDQRRLESIVDEAMQDWLRKTTCAQPKAAHQAADGYQWKSLFLPDGTLLRFDYRHQTYRAEVRGNHIIFEGRPYSPRQLLLHVTGSVRNAWRALWLRCPGDFRWHLADTRRRILRTTPRGAPAARSPSTRVVLHRDDIVRHDQPDLAHKLGGGGHARAGRRGPRDRRTAIPSFAQLYGASG